MANPFETFTSGAIEARKLADQCLEEAQTADAARAFHLISEHDRHLDRAKDYEMRASWYAPNINMEILA